MEFDYSEEQIDKLVMGLYSGAVITHRLPLSLYKATYTTLIKGVLKGVKPDIKIEFSEKDRLLALELKENIYMFSAAKTYQQVKEYSSFLTDEEGGVRSFADFKKLVKDRFGDYNKIYLEAEYDTAVSMADSAVKWNDIVENKVLFPYLKYDAVLDARTTNQCRHFDGVLLPVDHSFWKQYMPPNHWRCRSLVHQVDKYEHIAITDGRTLNGIIAHQQKVIPDLFKMNPGIDKVVFKTKGKGKHPYFDIEPKDRGFAKDNFDLPIPNGD